MILPCKLGCLLIQHDAEHRLLRYQWRAGATLHHFRLALDEVVALTLNHQIEHVVADLNNLPDLPHDVQSWLNTNWFAKASTTHLRCLAVVAAELSSYNLMVVESLLRFGRVRVNYEIQFFADAPTALAWCLASTPRAKALEAEWQNAHRPGGAAI